MYAEQSIKKIKIEKLKGLKDVEILVKEKGLTAIIGTNGVGKSTVLHALACAYDVAEPNAEIFRYPRFFRHTTHSDWKETKYELEHKYKKIDVQNPTVEIRNQKYYKTDRWAPRNGARIKRHVYYLGIETCVPTIEEIKKEKKQNFKHDIPQSGNKSIKIIKCMNDVMQREYTEISELKNERDNSYTGIVYNGLKYSSFSMGAGEQRILKIISTAILCPNYSLILIDEIDLLLHINAFNRLIEQLLKIAEEKSLQIVFTTHEKEIENHKTKLLIQHLWNTAEKTLCFENINLDALYSLTGVQNKIFTIYVEDELSKVIIEKIFSENKIKKYLKVIICGAAENCITLASGLIFNQSPIENVLIVLDGDVYREEKEKKGRILTKITGHGDLIEKQRGATLSLIKEYALPSNENPESFLFSLLKENSAKCPKCEIYDIVAQMSYVDYKHGYFDQIIERLGDEKPIGYKMIIEEVSKNEKWENFIKPVSEWLEERKSKVGL